MKHLVNSREVELGDAPAGVHIIRFGDTFVIRANGKSYRAAAVRVGDKYHISYQGRTYQIEKVRPGSKKSKAKDIGTFVAPMPGQITDVFVAEGDVVTEGQKLLVLEAMKTQQPIIAPFDGIVEQLSVVKGQQIGDGDLLIHVLASPTSGI
jgi:3-methylcrotonyl-CoA carboxylase alpha subunit